MLVSDWEIAIYLRLSNDDGDKDESDSIASQRNLITSYINKYLQDAIILMNLLTMDLQEPTLTVQVLKE